MALRSEIEAAMELGVGIELLRSFAKKCPKPGQARTLKFNQMGGERYFEDAELKRFRKWLSEPWPKPAKGQRPAIPKAIADDIRNECHHMCALCGSMNKGEIAHIRAVAETFDNSPDNLLLLCPNHHTEYDFGFKPSTNVTFEVIAAAKVLKRSSRMRIQRVEANASEALRALIAVIKKVETDLKAEKLSDERRAVLLAEAQGLLKRVPEFSAKAQEAGSKDQPADSMEAVVAKYAPTIQKNAVLPVSNTSERRVRAAMSAVVSAASEILIDLDEVECPHCGGAGLRGLVGDLCRYCDGAMVVSEQQAEDYERSEMDEVECPHCGGRGQTGLVGDLCAVCGGSCFLTGASAAGYTAEDVDEVDCPHCAGRGQTGLAGDLCSYCRGSCKVTHDYASEYNRSDIDEVDCPRCGGRGTTGFANNVCAYCKGSCQVSQSKFDEYDPEDIDEVDCPHCGGRGTTGLVSDSCAYCRGSCQVSNAKAKKYDPDKIDEEQCPRCGGQGTIGFSSDICKLCGGSQVVSHAKATAYRRKYRE